MGEEEQRAAAKEEQEDEDHPTKDLSQLDEGEDGEEKDMERSPTLIVTPLSVITNWQDQFSTHVFPGHLNAYTYHGPGRNKDVAFLEKHDVIITTYNILATEYNDPQELAGLTEEGKINPKLKKQRTIKQSPLFDICWKRVVLDEAQIGRAVQQECRDRSRMPSSA
eukprot:TRINITY_DN22637_c0_g1_i1.p1 TRINITY_DN22637_c0_g1~~TRINITY_DN22637_c0_g1_i1.p1  ORF type:complete len:166 (+),score=39.22 TRINITY_DN22637_c0_g1_i1:258-755(+)